VKLLYVKTVITSDVIEAAEFIRRGGIVAFPTETVYGLGANVFDPAAIAKIFEAKQRPADNPLIAHIASLDQINDLASEVKGIADTLITRFFPGPLTIVLKKTARVPSVATAGLDTIGIRMPRYDMAHRFITACGVPVVAPSANLSGRPSPTTWQAVLEDLDGRIDCILRGDSTEIGLESTVVDCTGEVPMLLRQGAVSIEQLRSVIPETTVYQQLSDQAPRSPGLSHRHYTPRANVVIVDSMPDDPNDNSAFIGLGHEIGEGRFAQLLICRDVEEYAHSLFEFFRECDRRGIETIYCERARNDGIGAALMDRIERAATRDR